MLSAACINIRLFWTDYLSRDLGKADPDNPERALGEAPSALILGSLCASASLREIMDIIFRSLTRRRGGAEKKRKRKLGYLGFLFLAFSRARSSSATMARFSSSTRPSITSESSSLCSCNRVRAVSSLPCS